MIWKLLYALPFLAALVWVATYVVYLRVYPTGWLQARRARKAEARRLRAEQAAAAAVLREELAAKYLPATPPAEPPGAA